MTVSIIRGDARALPLADRSVDLICTSPPYFGLRSYTDNGVHYEGQIGSEATPAEFVDALIACTEEWMRVLKPSGSIWINLGDKYDSGTTTARTNPGTIKDGTGQGYYLGSPRVSLGRPKSLIGIPWRYALRCIDDLGLILRAEVIWSKPNGLPESVTDRVRRSHEQWFHFTKEPRYFSAVDEIRESYDPKTSQRYAAGYGSKRELAASQLSKNTDYYVDGLSTNPLGKLPGSVWTVPTQPLIVPASLGIDHFAAFPMEWPRRIIRGWSPSGVCTACGEGRRPTTHKKPMEWRPGPKAGLYELGGASRKVVSGTMLSAAETTITGYACACPDTTAPTTSATVLDSFGGTGTTALVAHVNGRHGISVDMSADYGRLAKWRTSDPGELARAAQVEKPPAQVEGQLGLFDVESTSNGGQVA